MRRGEGFSLRRDESNRVNAAPPRSRGKSGSSESLPLLVLLALFGVIALMWALFIPIPAPNLSAPTWDGYNPDEQVHLQLIGYLAKHHALPVFGPPGSATIYTVVHPPLYHVVAAVLYGIAAPALGHASAVTLLRLFGCCLGVGTVLMTYRAARCLFPPMTALLAAGCVAGVPMFVSLSAAVTNEVAVAFASAGAFYAMADGLRHGFDRRRALRLALWVAAACAIKVTGFVLLPAALLALWLSRKRRAAGTGAGAFVPSAALLLGVFAAAVGWWLVRNLILYGDPFMARVHYAFWAPIDPYPWQKMMTVPQFFWNGAISGWMSFWGIFDAFTRPLPDSAYGLILLVQLPALVGLVLWLRRGGLRSPVRRRAAAVGGVFLLLSLVMFEMVNWRIYSPQGRYLFPLLTPLGVATSVGWMALLRRRPRFRGAATGLILVVLLLVNLFALAVLSVRPKDKASPPPATAAPPAEPG